MDDDCELDYVPEFSEEVIQFIENSIPIQKSFHFNDNYNCQIDGWKYLNSLKIVERKTINELCLISINLSAKEFCDILSYMKHIQYVFIWYSCLPHDEEIKFKDMEECKMEYLSLFESEDKSYSNLEENPQYFENLIKGIPKRLS